MIKINNCPKSLDLYGSRWQPTTIDCEHEHDINLVRAHSIGVGVSEGDAMMFSTREDQPWIIDGVIYPATSELDLYDHTDEKIVFLDIDGVLNNLYIKFEKVFPDERLQISKTNLTLFVEAIKEVDATVVISSTWRLCDKVEEFKWLTDEGIRLHKNWRTDYCNGWRGFEVDKWIRDNKFSGNYIILDDDGDFRPFQPLLQTQRNRGFSRTDADILKLHFGHGFLNLPRLKGDIIHELLG